jgi:hypothetical protein
MRETRTVATDWQKLKEERQWTEFKIFNKNITGSYQIFKHTNITVTFRVNNAILTVFL